MRLSKVRFDLIIAALLAELLWIYCLWQWVNLVIWEAISEPWHFSSFWDYYVVAFVFFLFAFCGYLIAYIMYTGIKGKNLIPFTIR